MTSTNDEKDVKSIQTSGPKGKAYYIELYKSLENALSREAPLSERTGALCAAWGQVRRLCAHSAHATHAHLLAWLERHTARIILQTEWQNPESSGHRARLDGALEAFLEEIEAAVAARDGDSHGWETQLAQRAEWIRRTLPEPWGHPVLLKLIDQSGPQPSHEEVLEWLKVERGVMFATRLRQLGAVKTCHDLGLALVTAVMERVRATAILDETPTEEGVVKELSYRTVLTKQAGFTNDVWELLIDLEFVLLYKLGRTSRCIELAKQTPLRDSYKLVERLRKRIEISPRDKKLWKNGKDVAIVIAEVIVTRCMVMPVCTEPTRAALHCCTLSLVRLLPAAKLPAEAAALAAPAATAKHLHTFANATQAQCTEEMKPFVCQLFVRAINAGVNELERLRLDTEKDSEARTMEQTLASWFIQLGDLLSGSPRIKCECALTAFSIHPSPAMFERLKVAPPLQKTVDKQEPVSEPRSEFGSWASDSHAQSNFVKTSETLKLKITAKQTNVLSTAFLSEGEALGLSPELCQDVAALLSGLRLKTLSWDMERERLLEVSRGHMERTGCGTRTLTTELRYLNLDPSQWMHLPEEDDGEGDLFYGIERGYEHLVELPEPEPEEIWADALYDSDLTETASDTSAEGQDGFSASHDRKKKIRSRKSDFISDENDPLSLTSERQERKERQPSKEKQTEKKEKPRKEKPKGEERSKSKKKRETSQERRKEMKAQKKREKKERKKQEQDDTSKPATSLSSLIGLKVCSSSELQPDLKIEKNLQKEKKKKPPIEAPRLSSESDSQVVYDGQFSMDELKTVPPPKPQNQTDVITEQSEINPRIDASRTMSPAFSERSPTPSVQSPGTAKSPVSDDVRQRITKLLAFRKQKSASASPMSSPNLSLGRETPTIPKDQDNSNSSGVSTFSGPSYFSAPLHSVIQRYPQLQVNPVPKVTNTVLKVTDTVQKVTNTAPKVTNTEPKMMDTVPKVTNTVPKVNNPMTTPATAISKLNLPCSSLLIANQLARQQDSASAIRINNISNIPATVTSQSQVECDKVADGGKYTIAKITKPRSKPKPANPKPRQAKPKSFVQNVFGSGISYHVTNVQPGQKIVDWQGLNQTVPSVTKETVTAIKVANIPKEKVIVAKVPTNEPKVASNLMTNMQPGQKVEDWRGLIEQVPQSVNKIVQNVPQVAVTMTKVAANAPKAAPNKLTAPIPAISTSTEKPRKIYGMKDFLSICQSQYGNRVQDPTTLDAAANLLALQDVRHHQKCARIDDVVALLKSAPPIVAQGSNVARNLVRQPNEVDPVVKAKKHQQDVPKTFSRLLHDKTSKQKQLRQAAEQEAISIELERHISEFKKLKSLQSKGDITVSKVDGVKAQKPDSAKSNPIMATLLNGPSPNKHVNELPRSIVPLRSTHMDEKEILSLIQQQNNLIGRNSTHVARILQYQKQPKPSVHKAPNATITGYENKVPSATVQGTKVVGFQNEFNKIIGQPALLSNNKAYLEFDKEPDNGPQSTQGVSNNTTISNDIFAPKSKGKSKGAPRKTKEIQNDLVSVMDALLAHKTPSRGPNALELALNKKPEKKKLVVKKKPKEVNVVLNNNQTTQDALLTPATLKPAAKPENKAVNRSVPFEFNIDRLIETEVAYQMNAKYYAIPDPNKLIATVKNILKQPGLHKLTQKMDDQKGQSTTQSAHAGVSTPMTTVQPKKTPAGSQIKPAVVQKAPILVPGQQIQSAPLDLQKITSPKAAAIQKTPAQKVVEIKHDKQFVVQTAPKIGEVPISVCKTIKIQKDVIIKPASVPKTPKIGSAPKRTQDKLSTIQEEYLLDELMDKELLEEIGELSSDEDTPKSYATRNKTQLQITDAPGTEIVIPAQSIEEKSLRKNSTDSLKAQKLVGMRVIQPRQITPTVQCTPAKVNSYEKRNPALLTVPASNIVLVRPEINQYSQPNPLSTQGSIIMPTPNLALYQTTQYAVPIVTHVIIGNATSVRDSNAMSNVATAVVNAKKPDEILVSTEANAVNDTNTAGTETKPKKKIEILEQRTLILDYMTRSNKRKVLHEVQEKHNGPAPESPIKTEKNVETVKVEAVVEKKDKVVRKDNERVKRKRLAILNREINQRCFYPPIPLFYERLTAPTVITKPDVIETVPNVITEADPGGIVKEIAKENSKTQSSCRRILLRSSNKIKTTDSSSKVAKSNGDKILEAPTNKARPVSKKNSCIGKITTPKRISIRNQNKKALSDKVEDKTVLPETTDITPLLDFEDELWAVEIPNANLVLKETPEISFGNEMNCVESDSELNHRTVSIVKESNSDLAFVKETWNKNTKPKVSDSIKTSVKKSDTDIVFVKEASNENTAMKGNLAELKNSKGLGSYSDSTIENKMPKDNVPEPKKAVDSESNLDVLLVTKNVSENLETPSNITLNHCATNIKVNESLNKKESIKVKSTVGEVSNNFSNSGATPSKPELPKEVSETHILTDVDNEETQDFMKKLKIRSVKSLSAGPDTKGKKCLQILLPNQKSFKVTISDVNIDINKLLDNSEFKRIITSNWSQTKKYRINMRHHPFRSDSLTVVDTQELEKEATRNLSNPAITDIIDLLSDEEIDQNKRRLKTEFGIYKVATDSIEKLQIDMNRQCTVVLSKHSDIFYRQTTDAGAVATALDSPKMIEDTNESKVTIQSVTSSCEINDEAQLLIEPTTEKTMSEWVASDKEKQAIAAAKPSQLVDIPVSEGVCEGVVKIIEPTELMVQENIQANDHLREIPYIEEDKIMKGEKLEIKMTEILSDDAVITTILKKIVHSVSKCGEIKSTESQLISADQNQVQNNEAKYNGENAITLSAAKLTGEILVSENVARIDQEITESTHEANKNFVKKIVTESTKDTKEGMVPDIVEKTANELSYTSISATPKEREDRPIDGTVFIRDKKVRTSDSMLVDDFVINKLDLAFDKYKVKEIEDSDNIISIGKETVNASEAQLIDDLGKGKVDIPKNEFSSDTEKEKKSSDDVIFINEEVCSDQATLTGVAVKVDDASDDVVLVSDEIGAKSLVCYEDDVIEVLGDKVDNEDVQSVFSLKECSILGRTDNLSHLLAPDVIEIESSSSDEFEQSELDILIPESEVFDSLSTKYESTHQEQKINEFKSLLLNELGVDDAPTSCKPMGQPRNRLIRGKRSKQVDNTSTDPKLRQECLVQVYKCDDLVEKYKLLHAITQQKCFVKLVKCDHMVEENNLDCEIGFNVVSPTTEVYRSGSPSILNNIQWEDFDVCLLEEDDENILGRTSPVIEIFEIISRIGQRNGLDSCQMSKVECNAEWFMTKRPIYCNGLKLVSWKKPTPNSLVPSLLTIALKSLNKANERTKLAPKSLVPSLLSMTLESLNQMPQLVPNKLVPSLLSMVLNNLNQVPQLPINPSRKRKLTITDETIVIKKSAKDNVMDSYFNKDYHRNEVVTTQNTEIPLDATLLTVYNSLIRSEDIDVNVPNNNSLLEVISEHKKCDDLDVNAIIVPSPDNIKTSQAEDVQIKLHTQFEEEPIIVLKQMDMTIDDTYTAPNLDDKATSTDDPQILLNNERSPLTGEPFVELDPSVQNLAIKTVAKIDDALLTQNLNAKLHKSTMVSFACDMLSDYEMSDTLKSAIVTTEIVRTSENVCSPDATESSKSMPAPAFKKIEITEEYEDTNHNTEKECDTAMANDGIEKSGTLTQTTLVQSIKSDVPILKNQFEIPACMSATHGSEAPRSIATPWLSEAADSLSDFPIVSMNIVAEDIDSKNPDDVKLPIEVPMTISEMTERPETPFKVTDVPDITSYLSITTSDDIEAKVEQVLKNKTIDRGEVKTPDNKMKSPTQQMTVALVESSIVPMFRIAIAEVLEGSQATENFEDKSTSLIDVSMSSESTFVRFESNVISKPWDHISGKYAIHASDSTENEIGSPFESGETGFYAAAELNVIKASQNNEGITESDETNLNKTELLTKDVSEYVEGIDISLSRKGPGDNFVVEKLISGHEDSDTTNFALITEVPHQLYESKEESVVDNAQGALVIVNENKQYCLNTGFVSDESASEDLTTNSINQEDSAHRNVALDYFDDTAKCYSNTGAISNEHLQLDPSTNSTNLEDNVQGKLPLNFTNDTEQCNSNTVYLNNGPSQVYPTNDSTNQEDTVQGKVVSDFGNDTGKCNPNTVIINNHPSQVDPMTDSPNQVNNAQREVALHLVDEGEKCYPNAVIDNKELSPVGPTTESPQSPVSEPHVQETIFQKVSVSVSVCVEKTDENCSFSDDDNTDKTFTAEIATSEPLSQNNDVTDQVKDSINSIESVNNNFDTEITYEINSPLIHVDARESTPIDYAERPGIILKGIEFKDPVVGTCYIFRPIDDSISDSASVKTDLNESDLLNESIEEVYENDHEVISPEDYLVPESPVLSCREIIYVTPEPEEKDDLYVKMPRHTYKPPHANRNPKRKLSSSEGKHNPKKYRKGKRIDFPKLTAATMKESAFSSEYKALIDYMDTVKFSYSRPFHKDEVDVHEAFTNWPIAGPVLKMEKDIDETDMENFLFNDVPDLLTDEVDTDPLNKTLIEELSTDVETEIASCEDTQTNFNMGFGEESGRVIQNLKEGGDISKFSAATLSDVKHTQPFLLSASDDGKNHIGSHETVDDQKGKLIRSINYIQLKDKVRSFFAKIKLDLIATSTPKDEHRPGLDASKVFKNVPGLYCTDFLKPESATPTVNVVQVGQLPVSAAAQNPVTIDPRVTQVSDASPSQCSVENSPRSDNNQANIKAEYTELTNADLSLPLVQAIAEQNQSATVKEKVATTPEQTVIPKEIEIRSDLKERIDLSNDDSTSETKQQNAMDFRYLNSANETITNICNDVTPESMFNASTQPNEDPFTSMQNQENGSIEKTDQIAHAMNAAGITTTPETTVPRSHPLVNILSQKVIRTETLSTGQSTNTYQKTSINAMALQQALAQILPPPLNQTSGSENGQQTSNTSHAQQVLHIVQGKNASGNQITLVDNSQQSVISSQNATQVLHIVQNKSSTGATSNGTPNNQNFTGLSLVDAGLQQGGNQLLHIVNTGNHKNANATGQLLKRVNLLTNLTNVQGGNEQKMVQFVCKSADGKAIHLNAPHQRSMVLRLQPIETSNVQANVPKPDQELIPTQAGNLSKDAANQQEIKSRSVYEENYAKFIQNSSTPKAAGGLEKSTSLPKFNQAFGKATFQEGASKQNEMSANNAHLSQENTEALPSENNINLEHLNQISSPPLLVRKTAVSTSQAQQNLVQQIKQSIAPMNMTMHGGVIYTRQIPVNIGGGQTINLITVPTTELIDESGQKQPNEIDAPIIKIVPQTQPNSESNADDNSHLGSSSDSPPTPQPQQVLTQMRIKLPMLSKTPQVVQGARAVRPAFFQIQRNVIGGANQGQVFQQLVLTAAPPLGQQTIRLPQAPSRQVKVQPETLSPSESQLSSSTLEQLREFDMVLEQVKERSTVQPSGGSNSNATFAKILTPTHDATDSSSSVTSNSTSTDHTQQVLYSIGNSTTMNVAYVNRKSTATTSTTSSYVRSPDSSGIVDSPSSSSSQMPQTVTETPQTATSSTSEASSSSIQPKAAKVGSKSVKSRPKPATTPSAMTKVNNPIPPKTSTQKPLEDEQTTQRILYILAEYKEQVENSPDKDKPAPRRRSNPPSSASGSKRKKSSGGSRRHGCTRDHSPVGDDNCRTMGSEDSSCGTSQGDCTESCSIDAHSPQDSPRKVVRKITFEQETPTLITQPRLQTPRNVIVADGQTITVARSATGKPTTAVLMPANYILPVSMMKGGQQIAIVTNRGPKLLTVGGAPGEAGAANALLLQRLIGPAGLKPVLARPGVRHVRLPATALHNLQAFNIQAAVQTPQPADSTASPAPARTPPDLVETRASSEWSDREPTTSEVKPERGSSPEASEPWHLQASAGTPEYTYEEPVTTRADNADRTVLVVQKKDGSTHGLHRVTHISSAALRHKYAILEHELRLQKSLSEECEDLGVDSPSASELFPEAELLFAASPAHDHSHHTPQSSIPQPDMEDQIATDALLPPQEHRSLSEDVNLGLGDVGIVTVSEDGSATIALDQEEFARAHPNTTFHSEPTDVGDVQPFSLASGLAKGRHITSTIFHSNSATATVLMTAPQPTVISQATPEPNHAPTNTVKYSDIDNMINNLPSSHNQLNLSSVLVKDDGLTRFDSILTDSRELHLSNTGSAIVHPNVTQVIRRVCYDDDAKRDRERFLMDENDGLIAGDDAKMSVAEESSRDATLDSVGPDDEDSSPERHAELFWESNSASERSESRRPLDFSSDSDKCCKSPSLDETNSTDSSGVGTHLRLDSVIKEARSRERSGSVEGSSADDTVHPPIRTYPPKRAFHNEGVERSLSGKTRAGERSSPDSPEVRRRASNRGVVKRGCHCCSGSPVPPRPKKPRQRKPALDFTNSN